MRRFVAASIAMVAVGVAFGMAAERSDLGSCNLTVHRPTREDEERTGVLAKEQRIKKELDELENALIGIADALQHLSYQRVGLAINPAEFEFARSKLESALIAAEEQLELFSRQNNITTKRLRGHPFFFNR